MRLIDANALNNEVIKRRKGARTLTGVDFVELVKSRPTIDAEPVRRGVWVPIDDEPHEDFECSACGYVSTAAFDCGGITPNAFPYCPMCGAKMDGDGDAR